MKNQQNTAHGVIKKIVIPNLIWNLQRFSLQLINSMRGRSRIKYGMTPYFKEEALNKNAFRAPLRSGFTLIELLVVVLIIGILAAVALPQYQFAVVKSRVASYFPLVKSIATAEILYVLSNGEPSYDVRKLDITLPSECTISGQWVTCGNDFAIDNSPSEAILNYCPDNTHSSKKCFDTRDFSIRFYHSGYKNNKSECITYNNSKLGTKICNSLHFN